MNNSINCETTFDTAKNTMKQIFSDRVYLVVDFNNLILATFIDDKMVDKVSFEKIIHSQILIGINYQY